MNKELSILIIGYKDYADCWPYFEFFFKKNWPDCPFEVIFSSNGIAGPNCFKTVCCKDEDATVRISEGLKFCTSNKVLVLLEDYCISSKVDNNKFFDAVASMENNSIDYLELDNFVVKQRGNKTIHKNSVGKIIEIDKKANYRISLQPAIWKIDFLKLVLSFSPKTLWDFENILKEKQDFFGNNIKAGFTKPRYIKISNFIERGKYSLESRKLIKKNRLNVPSRGFIGMKFFLKIRMKRFLLNILPSSLIRLILDKKSKNRATKSKTIQ